MPFTYPAGPPTYAGDLVTANRFLQSPTLVAKRVDEIARQRFISDIILSQRVEASGGAIAFTSDDALYADRTPESVSPGAEYPLTGISNGVLQNVAVVKWGQDAAITDEALKRSNIAAIEEAFKKLVNSAVKQMDSTALSLIASAVAQSHTASALWTDDANAKILRDIMLAKAKITALNKGYEPNVLVVDDNIHAILASDTKLTQSFARETGSSTVNTGQFLTIAGLTVLPTNNLPSAGAWLIDTNALGGIGREDLGGGYEGDVIETKSIRDEYTDGYRIRARRVVVPFVSEPGAAIKITGVSTP